MTKRVLGLAAAAAAIAAAFLLPVGAWSRALVEWVHGAGVVGALVFGAVYLIAPVALLPASVLTLGAGFLYGRLFGTLLTSPLSVGAASIAFLLGRTLARGAVERKVAGDKRFAAIDKAVAENGFKIVFLLRLSPVVPFNLLNYALGVTRVPFSTYLVASFLGMLPGTFLYVSLGAAATSAAQLGQGHGPPAALWVGVAATAVVVLLLTVLARRALQTALREAEAA
ncbi:MAG: hypothetical protein NVSMB23_16010 [Myxococcales bacterium]